MENGKENFNCNFSKKIITKTANFSKLKTPLVNLIYDYLTIGNIAELKKGLQNKKLLLCGNHVIK